MRLAALLCLVTGCATPLSALTSKKELATATTHFIIKHMPGSDGDQAAVAKAIEDAVPALDRWGALPRPVTIYVTPDHGSLESAIGRHGYGWLRAWAMYDEVLIQSPASWKASDVDLRELLTHEITHCSMYQRSGTPADWSKKEIPLWFREGMATWTAVQGHRWMTLEDLAHVYEEGSDPIAQAEEMYQSRSSAVYAAAHYAFTFLERRYGRDGITSVMSRMAAGAQFSAAFKGALGIDVAAFTAEFRRYVVWRAFRGTGKTVTM